MSKVVDLLIQKHLIRAELWNKGPQMSNRDLAAISPELVWILAPGNAFAGRRTGYASWRMSVVRACLR